VNRSNVVNTMAK